MKEKYLFQVYDVCQVNYDGNWLDFATIHDSSDARYAVSNVDYPEGANARYGWPLHIKAKFRIIRGCQDKVVYGE